MVNVYGPSSGDKPDFFDDFSYQIDRIGNQLIIAGGDWNVFFLILLLMLVITKAMLTVLQLEEKY